MDALQTTQATETMETMESVISDFIAALSAQRHSSANTRNAYQTDLRQLAIFLRQRGADSWYDVKSAHIAAYVTHLREGGYAATSIARKIAAAKSFCAYLRSHGMLTLDPAADVNIPRVEKYIPSTFTPQDVDRLLGAIPMETAAGQRDFAMLHALYSTGMRVSELVACDLNQLDLARGHIRCRNRNRRERLLPLTPAAQRALATYIEEGRLELAQRRSTETAIFLNHHGQRLTRQGFWLIVKGYAKQVGITGITPHTLRHSFALDMLGQGMDLRSVQELLGHANISTTQIYSQLHQARRSGSGALTAFTGLEGLENLESLESLDTLQTLDGESLTLVEEAISR